MAEVSGRLRQEETKLASERAQHSAAARDLMAAQEDVLELRRRIRVAVRALSSLHQYILGPVHSATFWRITGTLPASMMPQNCWQSTWMVLILETSLQSGSHWAASSLCLM